MQELYYTYYESPIGLIRIGGTDNFIAELVFIDNKDQIKHGEPGLSDLMHVCTEQLIEFFAGKRKQFNVPIHQEGTAFQGNVWSELIHIPFGSTISYLDLAKKIGDAKATRAVAAANGKNNIAIIVPCHRVIGSDKSLTGYAGGMWRKKWLLQHEFRIKNGIQVLFN
ncbi:MAG TPA: methylated-DNA--[protein]-cysteine S-methyltransferase [Chitinophagaceae bacterium]|nr:methylated-DNA--[protein]-cysteine S-methyltransferase [Chitinophagaceae bacterium]MCC6635240.1 methylated-DNA--[protein]-cysteine S-methyltransferase [Chitinophagaceae bacterium]HMZ46749.1 methylated-DNA--[protein]-cysteine S-methyltransferase [Chitinophagaceae bacterium]HNE93212.1 methylated-DNA--[protein]-cysteine S-methyltransferase [Chitinophagaceae bacterium]HNF29717.1 methylated-DNA--[protein]-cysteine S-methyltransferase [Chitinophagaceae bacterium]